MRILILGGNGMLGHKLLELYSKRYDVAVTLRQARTYYQNSGIFTDNNAYYNVDVCDHGVLTEVFQDYRPSFVINCVGYINRSGEIDKTKNIAVNALLPHRVSTLCRQFLARLIQVSTDCVFSGNKGLYKETNQSDAEKLYGKAKYLGEVNNDVGLTLRTSIIGLELNRKTHLVEWFLSQKTRVNGYTKAIYSGVTTAELGRVIEHIMLNHSNVGGIWHVAGKPISKYSLLCKLKEMLGMSWLNIEPDDTFVCDRSLVAEKFCMNFGYQVNSWEFMLNELVREIKIRGFVCENIRR